MRKIFKISCILLSGLTCNPVGSYAQVMASSESPQESQFVSRSSSQSLKDALHQLESKYAADIAVKGRVTSDEGEGLPGVSVQVKGTTTGTVTDASGSYALNVPEDGVLVFSFVGYTPQEVAVGKRATIDIQLAPDVKTLSEVMVVGYGTQQRRELTGSIASVSAEQINKLPVTGLDQALQGRAAGVVVTQNSGAPGAPISVQIRGVGTTRSTEPLYVIDGVIVSNNNDRADAGLAVISGLASINPNDIQSMEILKDAAATAIYGARAANGVILITTKRGVAGTPKVAFDSYYGVQNVWKTRELMNTTEYISFINEARVNSGEQPVAQFEDPNLRAVNTDWQKAYFRQAPIQSYNLNVSGGTENALFSVSGGYFNQQGIVVGTDFKRYSIRVNSDFKVGKRIKFGESLTVARIDAKTGASTLTELIRSAPYVPLRDANNEGGFGGPNGIEGNDARNAVGQSLLFENTKAKNRVLGNVYGEYEIISGLKYRLNLGTDLNFDGARSFQPTYQMGTYDTRTTPQVEKRSYTGINLLAENTFSYNKVFGDHSISAVAGFTQQTIENEDIGVFTDGLPTNEVTNPGSGNAAEARKVLGGGDDYAIRSTFGRVNYAFKGKYLFSASIRRDGSSRFGAANRYGVFPAVSAGWNISDEAFMANIPFLTTLKLRGSWGQLGNDGIGNYKYASTLSPKANYTFGDKINTGVTPTGLANPDIKWETTTTTNFGIDIGLLQNKITLTADVYQKVTSDLLVEVPIPKTIGVADNPTINAGKVRNRGIEFALGYQDKIGGLQYGISGNIAFVQNKLISLGGGEPIESGNILGQYNVSRTEEGQPIGSFYGFVSDGVYQNQTEIDAANTVPGKIFQEGVKPGDMRYKDLDKDGVLTPNDRTIIGNPFPNFTYGLNADASYKGFDFSLFFQGIQGNEIFSEQEVWLQGYQGRFNVSKDLVNRWNGEGTSNTIPRADAKSAWNFRGSDRFIEDGSFLRLKNIQLGYSLPPSVLSAAGGYISRVRVYVSAQNLLTFTKYSGYDPEIGSTGSRDDNQDNLARGIDRGTYPQARTFLFGLQVGF